MAVSGGAGPTGGRRGAGAGLLLKLWPLAVLSWIVAVVLLVTKDRWQGVENLVALLVSIGIALPWVAGLAAVGTTGPCSSSGAMSDTGQVVESAVDCTGGGVTGVGVLATVLLVAGVLGAAFAVVWLTRRLRARLADA